MSTTTNATGSVEVIIRPPQRDHYGWVVWQEGGKFAGSRYTVLIEEPGGGDVVAVYEPQRSAVPRDLSIDVSGHVVWIEDLKPGDLRELAAEVETMIEAMIARRAIVTRWQFEWGIVVEFSGWSQEMLMRLRDQIEAIVAALDADARDLEQLDAETYPQEPQRPVCMGVR